jgi:hypothetical protein
MTSLFLPFMAERAQFSCREIQAAAFGGWCDLGPDLFESGHGTSRHRCILQHVFVFKACRHHYGLTI